LINKKEYFILNYTEQMENMKYQAKQKPR